MSIMNTINLITATVAFCLYLLKIKTEKCTYLKKGVRGVVVEGRYLFLLFCVTTPEERAALAVANHTIAPGNG